MAPVDDRSLADVIDVLPDGAGPVGLLSSEEFTPLAEAFDRSLLSLVGARVAIVLAADPSSAQAVGATAMDHYRRIGAEPMLVDVLCREQANAGAVPSCDMMFLAGGDPANLLPALLDTPFWAEASARWIDGMGLAGASAGAMALSRHCLVPTPGADKPTVWDRGLGPLERFGLAVHAATRPKEWVHGVASTAPVPVVAIDDGIGVLLAAGSAPQVIGEGRAWVVEPGG